MDHEYNTSVTMAIIYTEKSTGLVTILEYGMENHQLANVSIYGIYFSLQK